MHLQINSGRTDSKMKVFWQKCFISATGTKSVRVLARCIVSWASMCRQSLRAGPSLRGLASAQKASFLTFLRSFSATIKKSVRILATAESCKPFGKHFRCFDLYRAICSRRTLLVPWLMQIRPIKNSSTTVSNSIKTSCCSLSWVSPSYFTVRAKISSTTTRSIIRSTVQFSKATCRWSPGWSPASTMAFSFATRTN